MSDVLLYNAIKQNFIYNRATTCSGVLAAGAAAGTIAGTAAAPTTGLTCFLSNQIGFGNTTIPETWKTIPRMTAATGGVSVCDATGYFRCGATCSWVVPAGITCAEFQLWGPGGGTASGQCCGGAPHGPTGAYAVVALPVTAGATYVVCAGCAQCCFASIALTGQGGPTYVTGPGLTGLCADGGVSCVCNWRQSLPGPAGNPGGAGLTYPGGAATQFPSGDSCGPEVCSGWNFCWDTSADGVVIQDHSFSCVTKFAGTATSGTVYGLSGMYPTMILSLTNTGVTTAAPVYGFEASTRCQYLFNGNTCMGCLASPICGAGFLRNPGSGGYASGVYGGNTAQCGDPGRMGMVCVKYK
jgi:hypothetical protein